MQNAEIIRISTTTREVDDIEKEVVMPLSDIVLLIDDREEEIVNLFKANEKNINLNGVFFKVERLNLADFQFIDKTTDICFFQIERKTIDDMKNSEFNEHWPEQRTRMIDSKIRSMILIEGDLNETTPAIVIMINTIMEKCVLLDDIHCKQTTKPEETVEFLVEWVKRLKKIGQFKHNPGSGNKKKREIATPEDFLAHSLVNVNGITLLNAKAIAKRYGSMVKLLNIWKKYIPHDKKNKIEHLLSNQNKILHTPEATSCLPEPDTPEETEYKKINKAASSRCYSLLGFSE
jgi:ERCC4-type nuclease